ncbi:L-alanine exporter AlaE [Rhodobacterales bacterium HKCCE2091]|nr:L-alanine exporter AlaE [Rhodobacterales bacterium HKCCE2091]
MRRFLVDTVTTILFFTLVAGFAELVIAGLDPAQVAVTRALTIPVMILTARPYAAWRDFLMAWAAPRGPIGATLTDAGAFLTFQAPVYATTLAIAGAGAMEIAGLVALAVPVMLLVSRPFGLTLDTARRVFRVTAPLRPVRTPPATRPR